MLLYAGGYNFKSDIWSLGCLLYELATLRSPFYSDGINFYVLGKRIMGRKFEPISEDYSQPLAAIVDRMLQIDPSNRPTAAEIFEACVAASGTS